MSAEQLFEARIQGIREGRASGTLLPYAVSGGATYPHLDSLPKEAKKVASYLKRIVFYNLKKNGHTGNRVTLDITDGDVEVNHKGIEITLEAGHDSANGDRAQEALLDLIDESWDEATMQVLGQDFFDSHHGNQWGYSDRDVKRWIN
jgi:hypothetical protein